MLNIIIEILTSTVMVKLLALVSIIYLVVTLVFALIRPMSSKRKKRARDFLLKKKNQQRREKFIFFKDIILRRLSKSFLLSELKKEEFRFIIRRLDLKIPPEEIRLQQITYALLAAVVSIFLIKIFPILGYICLIMVLLGWMYPIDELEKKIEKRNKNILMDFPSFYSMVYYQYSRSINIFLADVVKDFLPNANPDMAEELGVLLDNIEYGEEYALKQLRKRVPLRHIFKFCDIMETRLKGYDNTSQMAYLKNELYDLRVATLEDELNHRKMKNARTQIALLVILGVYIVVYYYFQVMTAIQLFS